MEPQYGKGFIFAFQMVNERSSVYKIICESFNWILIEMKRRKAMDKIMISHASSLIITPFLFSFIVSIGYAIYELELAFMFSGIPFVMFSAFVLLGCVSPIIFLVDFVKPLGNLKRLGITICVAAIFSFAITQFFYQTNGIDYTLIVGGMAASIFYLFLQMLLEKVIVRLPIEL